MSDEDTELLEEDTEGTVGSDTENENTTETDNDPDPQTFSVTFDFGEYEANQLLDMAVDDNSTSVTIEGVDSDHGASLTPVSGWSVREYDEFTQIWSLTDDSLLGWSSNPDSKLIYFKPGDTIYADTENMTLYSVYAKSIVANIRYHNNFVPNVVIEDERFLIGGTHELSAIGDLQGFDNVGYSFVKWNSDSEYVPYYDKGNNKWKIDIFPNDEASAVNIDLSASWGRLRADLYYNNNISGSPEVSVADHRNSFSTGTYALSSTDALGNDFKNPGYVFNGWTAESDLMVDVFYDDTSNQWKITLPPELEKVDIMIWMDTCQAAVTNGLIPTLKSQIRAVFSANPENRIALVQTANSSYSVGEGANYYLVPDAATDKDRGPTIDFTNNEETLLAAIDLISAFNSSGVTNHNAENLWNSIFAATDVQHFSWSNDGRRKILIAITDEPCDCYNYVRRKLINGTVSTHHQIQGETSEGLLFGNTSGIQPNYDYSTVGVHTSPEEFVTLLLNNNLEFYFFGCIMPNYTEPQKTNEGKYLGFLDNEIVQPLIAQNGTGRTYNASMSTLARDIESLFRFDLSHTITLRANWAKEYKIRYHANYDGAQPEVIVDDRSIIDSGTIQLEENQFTRPAEGFTWGFVGWSKTPDGEISYADKDFVYFDIEEGDLDLYAVWDKALNFNIFYHKEQNDDGIEDYRNPITAEGNYALVANFFVKSGYDFVGWNTQAGGGGDSYDDEEIINVYESGILNLYAQWKAKNVVVSFLPGRNGIAGTMEPVNTGANPAEYTVPECGYHDDRGYYVFTKWRVNDGNQTFYYQPGYKFSEKIDPETGEVTDDRLTHDITMIAEWKYNGDMPETECSDLDPDYKDGGPKDGRKYVVEKLCKIVFYSGWGDNESYEQCCALGFKTYLMPEQFSEKRPGYKFMGWGVAMNDDVVYEDQDLYLPTQCPSYLYGQWKKEGDNGPDIDIEEEACIVGYDPFPVVFRDMSDVRSFKTKYWRWDFGDSIVYGCDTSATTTADFEDPDSLYWRFSLPGDDVVYDLGKSKTINCELLFKNNIDYFHDVLPQCLMNIDYYDWGSYHYKGHGDALKHFTGINFKSNTEATSGSGFIDYTNYDAETTVSHQHRFRRLPNDTFATWVSVTGIDDKILPDQCARIACEQEYDFGNSVAHIYKGPGLYYSTMVCSSENQSPKTAGLQGMELASYIYDADIAPEDKQKVAGCWVNVLPVCPCVSGFHVYGTYQGNSWADDTVPYNSPNRQFLTITNGNYSCDEDIAAATGHVGWNCNITFTDFDGNERTTQCVSGYAPYLQIGASGVVVPRSLPVTGAWFDWSDWNSDYMDKDHRFFGEVIRGWPTWATKPLDASGNVIWDAPEEALHNISGDHVYTLPGLYSVGISPEFDKERIRRYMPTVRDYEYCAEDTLKKSASGCCVLVVEIPPKFETNGFDWVEPSLEDRKKITEVSGFHANVRAGSYPISRIDWDFGDGSEILSISTEGFRVKDKDVIDNFGYGFVDYNSELNTVRRDLPASSLHKITTGYLNGNSKRNCFECKDSDDNSFEYERNPYERRDARDYLINHKYIRTNIGDGILKLDGSTGYGYMVRVSAYAENTNTCAVYEYPVLTGGVGLPDFDEEEGFVEMVDIRTDSTMETNIVLQSKKEDRLYVNRIIETDESYVPVPVVEPVIPSGDSPSGDITENKTYYCLIAPEERFDFATTYPPEKVELKSKFNMCIDVTDPNNIIVSGLNLFTDYKAGSRVTSTNLINNRIWMQTHVVRISTVMIAGNSTMTTDGDNWRVEIPVVLTWEPIARINKNNPQQTIQHNLSQLRQDLNLSGYGQTLIPKIVISGDKTSAFVDLLVAKNFNSEMDVISSETEWWYLRPDDQMSGYGSIMHRECQYVQTIDS